MSYKTQETLRIIGILLLAALVIGLLISFGGTLFNKNDEDGYSKVKVKWSVGGLDETGAYLKTETDSLVTEPILINEGIKIVPDFDKTVTYDLQFFDGNYKFLGNLADLGTQDDNVYTLAEIQEKCADAMYFRLILNDIEKDDGYITWFEKQKLCRYVTIYTTKEAEATETTDSSDET